MERDNVHKYDFIIAGGGAAGLSLANALARSSFKDRSILIVDRDDKKQNDRTWCFWVDHPFLYDDIVYRSWDQIAFYGEKFEKVLPLAPFSYKMIRGIDFYTYQQAFLSQFANVHFLRGNIEEVGEENGSGVVRVEGQVYSGRWVFDSLIRPGSIQRDPGRFHDVRQHFLGWEIETENDCFRPSVPTLFDFRTPQDGAMRFMYVLPFSPRRALVEYTLFSPDLLTKTAYEQALTHYLDTVLQVGKYTIHAVEDGVIPMTDYVFPRRLSEHVMAIGTKGGRVKPSSGYAFLRMVRDAERIVQSLERSGSPFDLALDPARYRFYDRVMLQLMQRQGGKMEHVFTQMFKNNPVPRIFRFLDEQQSMVEDARLMASLPVWLFFRAMLKVYLQKSI